MTNNTLDQIKQTEQEAEKIIAEARQKSENLVLQTNKNGEKSINEAENQVGAEIEKIVENARKEIQNLKVKQERNLENQLQKLNSTVDEKAVKEAASLITKKITN